MPDQPTRRVAVIAVHGVADQQPGDTAGTIADLLSNIDEGGDPAYGPFSADPIRVPVRKLDVPDQNGQSYRHKLFADVAIDRRKAMTKGDNTQPQDAGLDFMSSLLADYEPSGPEGTYETTVLRGTRRTNGKTRTVDVFEMYWADLSRLSQSWIRIFAEIYQLLFHFGSLGVNAVRAAQASEPAVIKPDLWRSWTRWQLWAANLLAHPILMLNLFLIALLPILVANIPSRDVGARILWVAFGLIAVLTTGLIAYRWYARHVRAVGPTMGLLLLWAAFAFLLWKLGWPGAFVFPWLATLFTLLVAVIVAFVVKAYDAHRPGVWRWARWAGAATVVFLLSVLWTDSREEHAVLHAVVHTAEVLYAVLRISFVAFLFIAWVSVFAGWRVTRGVARGDRLAKDRLDRVKWTARLTLALPAVLFLLAMTLFWGALWPQIDRWAKNLGSIQHKPYAILTTVVIDLQPALDRLATTPGVTRGSLDHLVKGLIETGAGPGFLVLFLSVVLAVAFGLYAVGPSVLNEIRPPPPRDGTANGRWLDGGFRLLRWAGRAIFLGVFVVLPLGPWLGDWVPWLVDTNQHVQAWAVGALGVAGGGLFLFRSRLMRLAGGLRSVVDVALDVDNYLREHPRASNPRGRIAARMSSLLKHIYRGQYDAIVIIAHSQGTVITADLLRFIHLTGLEQTDPDLAARKGAPIYLFTMGSPLRQLYGLRFPHLYHWARHHQDPWLNASDPIPPTTGPDPADLDVTQWVNAYRSGDYVGRFLWRPEPSVFAYTIKPIALRGRWPAGSVDVEASETAPPTTNRREFCIGSGAHQHYWDGYAPAIALELDRLITR